MRSLTEDNPRIHGPIRYFDPRNARRESPDARPRTNGRREAENLVVPRRSFVLRGDSTEAQRGQELSRDVREKIAESLEGLTRSKETRQKMSESTAGEQNPNWRGGYSRRYGPGWSIARQSIRKRDKVCQNCGHDGSDHRLEVHHIIPIRVFQSAEHLKIQDAHGEENLVLLCKRCHGRAEHGKIEFDAPIEMLFEGKSGNSLRAKSPHSDRAI